MRAEPVHTIVLCEDLQHATFVSRFLKLRGWHRRQILERLCPAGKGSGEQWVRQQLPRELKAFRSRSGHAKTCLIVVVDADAGTVEEHVRELDQACKDDEQSPRSARDRVLYVIPRRNIESWLAYLRGEDVDEGAEYPRHRRESQCQTEVAALDSMCRDARLRDPAPPSLAAACEEFRRLGP